VLKTDNTVNKAVQVLIVGFFGQIVEKQRGTALLREEVLEADNLPSVAQRVLREQADFGRLSKTTRDGATRFTSSKVIFVVSPSSRSDA
jgi:hypothetical protein